MFDLVVRRALVVDGSGRPGNEGDIAVAGDRIARLGDLAGASPRREIDGRGLVACPGFVDIHSHSDYHLILTPRADSAVRQGVTTEVGGNCGYAAAPIWGPWLEDRARSYREVYGMEHAWTGVADYYDLLERIGISVNFSLLIGHNTLRGSAMGGAARRPAADELQAMVEGARRGMAEGATGLSTGLVYAPACFSEPPELVAIARPVREAGGILTCHMRSEGDGLLQAIQEIIGIAHQAEIPLQISHLKTSGERNWGKLSRALGLIEGARARGQDVTCDRYPYTAANTGLSAVLPNWAIEGTVADRTSRWQDPEARRRIHEDLERQPPATPWDRIMISEVTLDRNRGYPGLRVAEAAQRAGKDPLTFTLDLLTEEQGRVDAIYFSMSEENLRVILQKPYIMVGSDSGCRAHYGPLSGGRPHPRTFGTFARVLGHYVRDEKLLDLSAAIRRMTHDPCRRLGLKDRGLVREGYAADLVLFDPDKVRDAATYEEPIRYPQGIRYVLVNGVVTVQEGEHTGACAGRPLRKGRDA